MKPTNMKHYSTFTAAKYENKTLSNTKDKLIDESPLQININFLPYVVTMRTPGNDKELVRGLLFTENIYNGSNDEFIFSVVEIDNKTKIISTVKIEIAPHLIERNIKDSRNILTGSSCGICGISSLDDLQKADKNEEIKGKMKLSDFSVLFDNMYRKQELFHDTGGSHAAALIGNENKILHLFEDIGRHNAVDKCIGNALLLNNLQDVICLLVSGRVSFEIVQKAAIAKVAIIASVSSPSSYAVNYAKEIGITLIGFCRGEKLTIYSNSHRLEKI